MGFFDRFKRRQGDKLGGSASSRTRTELAEFMQTRTGVEAYIEPPTPIYAMTLCLVAADGEHIRRAVKDEREARELCKERGVPLYDARIVGYPRRMKEFERGVRQQGISLDDLPPLEVAGEEPEDPREQP